MRLCRLHARTPGTLSALPPRHPAGGSCPGKAHRASPDGRPPPFTFLPVLPSSLSLQATGLESTAATRAAFLVQLTSLLTPALSALAGERIPPLVWAACCMGLVGGCCIAYDSVLQKAAAAAALPGATQAPDMLEGELLILASCFFFAMAIVRLGAIAGKYPALQVRRSLRRGALRPAANHCSLC